MLKRNLTILYFIANKTGKHFLVPTLYTIYITDIIPTWSR